MYPKYSDLTEDEKALVNNGCGPVWMPGWCKKLVFSWMFHAQCGHHDWGYTAGGNEFRRWYCDLRFGWAIAKDATRNLYHAIVGTIIGPLFFLAVFLFGWSSFNYGRKLTKEQALKYIEGEK